MTKTQRHSWQSIWFVAIAIIAGGPSLNAASLTLTASPNPAMFGERITFTANVVPSAATGKVTFYDGDVVLGTAAISGGHATLGAAIAATGNRKLVARYLGDAQNSAATSPTVSEPFIPSHLSDLIHRSLLRD
jgi:Bacterial Ig-like domain (group 3)